MVGLPTGTVTFLFTDIEASTLLWEQHPDTMPEMLARHDAVLRDVIGAHEGVVFSTAGDGVAAAFQQAGAAVGAAVEAQRRLEAESRPDTPVRVRMGLHTGTAQERAGDYLGPTLNRCARLMATAHGGQVVCSAATAELVSDEPPAGTSLLDLGEHRLRDLAKPERVFQLMADGLPSGFPALRSLETYVHNLPVQRSSFVGQDRALAELPVLLADRRLVTLTGIGGCGKTRLALQVAAEQLDQFPDGVFFVELAPISDPSLIWPAVVAATSMPMGSAAPGRSLADEVCSYLSRRRVLLVIDNCEHLLDASAEAIDRILSRCEHVRVLATSREALDAEGEQTWRVPSLPVPGADERVMESDAVRLFCDRAAAARAGFVASGPDEEAVAEICRRLDGIPLAIELAAARVAHLSPRQISDRLHDRFRLLTGGRRVQRQQTLQATMDWSHDLLDEAERAVLRRLAVFAGDFSLEAAEGVCDGHPVEGGSVLDVLGSLVSKSLVAAEQLGEATRYRQLETVRLYGADKLVAAGEAERYRGRHRDWYIARVDAKPLDETLLSRAFLEFLITEVDNLRAAMQWSLDEGRRDLVAHLAAALTLLWPFSGQHEEGQRWLQEALAGGSSLTVDERVACLAAQSWVGMIRLDPAMDDYARQAVEVAQGSPSGSLVIALCQRALYGGSLAEVSGRREHLEAVEGFLEQARIACRTLPPVWERYRSAWVGQHLLISGEVDRAVDTLAGVVSRMGPDEAPTGRFAQAALAAALLITGDTAGALDAARAANLALGGSEAFGGHVVLAGALAASGDMSSADQVVGAELSRARDTGVPLLVNDCLLGYAILAWYEGRPERTSRLLARAISSNHPVVRFRSPATYALWRHFRGLVRRQLDPATAHRCRDEGRAMSEESAIRYAREEHHDD